MTNRVDVRTVLQPLLQCGDFEIDNDVLKCTKCEYQLSIKLAKSKILQKLEKHCKSTGHQRYTDNVLKVVSSNVLSYKQNTTHGSQMNLTSYTVEVMDEVTLCESETEDFVEPAYVEDMGLEVLKTKYAMTQTEPLTCVVECQTPHVVTHPFSSQTSETGAILMPLQVETKYPLLQCFVDNAIKHELHPIQPNNLAHHPKVKQFIIGHSLNHSVQAAVEVSEAFCGPQRTTIKDGRKNENVIPCWLEENRLCITIETCKETLIRLGLTNNVPIDKIPFIISADGTGTTETLNTKKYDGLPNPVLIGR